MLSVSLTQKASLFQAAEEDLCTSTKSCAQLKADAGGVEGLGAEVQTVLIVHLDFDFETFGVIYHEHP